MIKLTSPSTYCAKQLNLNYSGLLVVIHILIAFARPSFLMSFFSLSFIHDIFYMADGFTEDGTVSILSPGSRPEDQTNELYVFLMDS